MYDAASALFNIDLHKSTINYLTTVCSLAGFVYFGIAMKLAFQQKVYVIPFIPCALFFWHDASFSMNYHTWQTVYSDHWWLRAWTFSDGGTAVLEAFLILQFVYYGRREIMPEATPFAFGLLTVMAMLGIGALWWLIKADLDDPIYLVTFTITAIFSIPFHTGIMIRRRSRAGQSVVMQACVIVIFGCISGVVMQTAPFFRSPPYIAFFATFMMWPLVNILMILRYPPLPAGPIQLEARAVPS